jgi:hypothetical protein
MPLKIAFLKGTDRCFFTTESYPVQCKRIALYNRILSAFRIQCNSQLATKFIAFLINVLTLIKKVVCGVSLHREISLVCMKSETELSITGGSFQAIMLPGIRLCSSHCLFPVVVTSQVVFLRNKLLRARCHQLVNNVQTISDLLEQLVASLLPSSTLLAI